MKTMALIALIFFFLIPSEAFSQKRFDLRTEVDAFTSEVTVTSHQTNITFFFDTDFTNRLYFVYRKDSLFFVFDVFSTVQGAYVEDWSIIFDNGEVLKKSTPSKAEMKQFGEYISSITYYPINHQELEKFINFKITKVRQVIGALIEPTRDLEVTRKDGDEIKKSAAEFLSVINSKRKK